MFNKIYASIKNKFKLYKKELIFLLLFAIIINIRFPYYIDAPGGTLELDKRIVIPNGKKVNGNNLTIYIDKVGGVTIDDCEALHRLIDAPLDELDPTGGVAYTLNVSSCGLDRPLKNLKDGESI